MRLQIDTYKVPFRFIGALLILSGIILMIVGLVWRDPTTALSSFGPPIIGLFLVRSRSCLIMRPSGAVLDQVERTLSLMAVRHAREGNTVSIPATGTAIGVRRLGPISLVTFTYAEGGSTRERYLRDTVIKFQRFTARE